MTLCDAGPLIAMINHREPLHGACVDVLDRLRLPLITTWPALTEAMYFLGASAGWPYQQKLWAMVEDQVLQIHAPTADERHRIIELMGKYGDVPMDLADASLVAAAETLQLRKVFSLDKDFLIYRTADGGTFDVVSVIA